MTAFYPFQFILGKLLLYLVFPKLFLRSKVQAVATTDIINTEEHPDVFFVDGKASGSKS